MRRSGNEGQRPYWTPSWAHYFQSNTAAGGWRSKVGSATLLRWIKVPEFEAAYRAAKRAAYRQAIARLQQAMPLAVQTMLKVRTDPDTPASVRVRAAQVIANHSHKAIEIEDVEARVTALEEAAGDQGRR